jgi:hypothetical protein
VGTPQKIRFGPDAPALLLVELVAHDFGELLELALALRVVGVDHEVLEVPEPPREILEPLALFEEAGDLSADLKAVHDAT